MASRQQKPPPSSLAPKPTAQQVGNEFVVSYYAALRNSPVQFQNFYQHNSLVSRPDPYGVVYTANKKQAINRDILSVGDGMPVEIMAVGAQYSVDCGVIVVAKGYLIGDGGVKRGFTQSFFLEPKVLTVKVQRYYISNDIFMYEDGEHMNQPGMAMANGSGVAQHADEQKVSSVLTTSMASVAEESLSSVAPVAKVIFSAVPTIKTLPDTSVTPAAVATPVTSVTKTLTATSVAPVAKVIFSTVPTIKTSLGTSVASVAVAASVAPVAVAPVDKTLTTEKSPSTVQGDVQAPLADKGSSSIMQGDASKKSFPRSFASIVKDLRDNPAPFALPPNAPAKPRAPARPKPSNQRNGAPARPKPSNQRNGASARPKPSNQRNGPHPGTPPSMVDNFGLNFKLPNYTGSSGRQGDAKAAYSRSNGHSGNSQSVAPPKLYFC